MSIERPDSLQLLGQGLFIRACRHFGWLGAEIKVEDLGQGIGDEEAAAVFEPFDRGSATRQCRQTGSGLGLAIVKSAVRGRPERKNLRAEKPLETRAAII